MTSKNQPPPYPQPAGQVNGGFVDISLNSSATNVNGQSASQTVNQPSSITNILRGSKFQSSDESAPKKNFISAYIDKIKQKRRDKGKSEEKDVSTIGLFRYSDFRDKILIFIGTFMALGSGGLFPLMFVAYGQASGTFVNVEQTSNVTSHCKSSSIGGTTSNPDDQIAWTTNFYVMIGFLSLLCDYLCSVCWDTAGHRQIKRIRNKLFAQIVRQDMGFFDKNTPGELNSSLTGNMNLILLGFGYKAGDFIALMSRALACLILALVAAWKFSIVFLAFVPFSVLSTTMLISVYKKYTIKEFAAYGSAGKVAQEVLSSIRTVISLGLQKRFMKTYRESLVDAENMALKKGFLAGFFLGCATGLFNLIFAVGLYYAAYLYRTECNNYTPGDLMLSLFAMVTTTFSLGQALPFLSDLSAARGAAKRVYYLIERESLIDVFKSKGVNNVKLQGEIEFENVTFSYPQRPGVQILKGLDLKIPAGKTVAFCGSSGGGKSTVIGLLQRFYLQSGGTIKIDGRKIDDYELAWLRSQMALVSQEPILFSTTIRENIRIGRLDATDAEVEEAAKNANAHNFIMTCTKQYDTPVGERGAQLSGGQKQRIAIARALLRNPKILLLDEATSALDYESEKIVQEALDRAKVGRTTIVIAHRLSTIRNADLIFGLVSGKVAEVGTHEELMERRGVYHELVTMQTKEAKKKEEEEVSDDEEARTREEAKELRNKETAELRQAAAEESETNKETGPTYEEQFKKKAKKPLYLERRLIKMNRPEWCWMIAGSIAQMINGAVFPAQALVFSNIYTIFNIPDPDKQTQESLKYMGILIAFAVVSFGSSILYSFGFAIVGTRLTTRVRMRMFESMLRQEISFHDREENRSSILSTQLATTAPFCKGLTADKISLFSQAFAGVGFAVIMSFILSWKLCLVMLIFVPITFFSGVVTGKAGTDTKVKGKSNVDEGGRVATEVIENIRSVVSLGRETYFIDEFESIFNYKYRKQLCMLHIQAICYAVSNSVLFFVQATAFSFGYYLIKHDGLSVTALFQVYAAITFSSMILGRVYAQMPDQSKARSSAKTSFRIIERPSAIDSLSEDGLRPDKIIGDIRFINVFFNYPQRPGLKILRGLNLDIKHDETNALVGPSGCGKSTTIALLQRYYDISGGSITLDGVDIRKLNIQWLRSKIGLVSQEPTLFNYTIKENIMFGDSERDDIPMSEIVDACIQANINTKIENLPDKYETNVGTKGGQLSGGEKQRVAIARALIRKPKLLLLDEATSALDTQSEQVVQDALDKAQKGRTSIVIAHRLSTIQNANKICVFKEGTILEEGTHQELMNNRNFYYNLQSKHQASSN